MERGRSDYLTYDYVHDTPPRVFGTETETNSDIFKGERVFNYLHFGRNLTADKGAQLIDYVPEKYVVSHARTKRTSAVLSTGGELYVDSIGVHDSLMGHSGQSALLEAATAECLTPEQVRIHEHANLKILVETASNLADALALPGCDVYKRSGYVNAWSADGDRLLREGSLGHHESYYTQNAFTFVMYDERDDEKDLYETKEWGGLTTFLVLRKLIDGAGMVSWSHYSISQKPDAYKFEPVGNCQAVVHGQKTPLIIKADRFEIRTGEGNKSDWVIEQKIALTSLLLRMIDNESYPMELILADRAEALRQISRDPWAKVRLETGREVAAPDLLREIVHRAREEAEKRGTLPRFESHSVAAYDAFYRDLQNVSFADNHVGELGKYVDWAGRLQHLYSRGARHTDISARSLEQVAADLKWDRISGHDIGRAHFRRFGQAALIREMPTPPETRAKWRVQRARELSEQDILRTVDWGSVSSTDASVPAQIVESPFETSHPQNIQPPQVPGKDSA